jgi:hypothetical protein
MQRFVVAEQKKQILTGVVLAEKEMRTLALMFRRWYIIALLVAYSLSLSLSLSLLPLFVIRLYIFSLWRGCVFLHASERELKNGKSITPSDAAFSLSLTRAIFIFVLWGPLFSARLIVTLAVAVVVVSAGAVMDTQARNDGHCCEQKAARDLYLHLGRPFAT